MPNLASRNQSGARYCFSDSQAGWKGPLNRCSVYANQAAGARLNGMLEMGQSRPWQEALEKIAGTRQMDATAILDYFAPLSKWLDQELAGTPVGW